MHVTCGKATSGTRDQRRTHARARARLEAGRVQH